MSVLTVDDFDSEMADRVGFGTTCQKTASALRKLADAMEQGRAQPSRVLLVQRARHDEFHSFTLHLDYEELRS